MSCRDRPGVLFEIANELLTAGLSVRSAHVGAYGERVRDVFYVEPMEEEGFPPENDRAFIDRLTDVLRAAGPNPPKIPAHTLARAPASTNR